jgi:hypothetical protein
MSIFFPIKFPNRFRRTILIFFLVYGQEFLGKATVYEHDKKNQILASTKPMFEIYNLTFFSSFAFLFSYGNNFFQDKQKKRSKYFSKVLRIRHN